MRALGRGSWSRKLVPVTIVLLVLVYLAYTWNLAPAVAAPHFVEHADSTSSNKLTVIITGYHTTGLRPVWLKQSLERYASAEYGDVVEDVLLVWNEPTREPPFLVPAGVTVVSNGVNSLNNRRVKLLSYQRRSLTSLRTRWIATLPFIKTRAVLVLDDDVQVTKAGVTCLHSVWRDHSKRLVGPFARRRNGARYDIDELVTVKGSEYSFVLPRVMLVDRRHLEVYAKPDLETRTTYVDKQEAHCDDLLLNSVASNATGLAPLRVVLPPGSLIDYATICGPLDRSQTSGLADQDSRWMLRSDCLRELVGSDRPESRTHEVAICSDDGASYGVSDGASLELWRSMTKMTAFDLCPELAPTAAKLRTGLGRALQQYCPETHPAMSEWIDSIVEYDTCDKSPKQPLIDSAKYQCGAWCVWDLRRRDARGWQLTPPCFAPFNAPHQQCDDWFFQRPDIDI
ncbi:hypothetical protein OIV83_004238 [Microbotryomycetes sp. JL201]|nr:hypothetical protein OIV83_004238 [Microbotryomycetes sp. JL201]